MYITGKATKEYLKNIPETARTKWFSGDVSPSREGVYLVKFSRLGNPEFTSFERGRWRIPNTNPNVVIFVNMDYARYLEWQGVTEEGYPSISPLVV